jgi:hypothetical protein
MAEAQNPRPESPVASIYECILAARDLSDSDIRRLTSCARLLLSTVRGLFHHTEADDLRNEALLRTLDGRRKWKPDKVDFVTHLMGCMRSIVHELKKKAYAELKAMRESERQEATRKFEYVWPSEILDYTRTHLSEDAVALRVFDLLRQGQSPAEIREALNIDLKVYNAARKTISRRMNDLFARWRASQEKDIRHA